MIICPDCTASLELTTQKCSSCTWEGEKKDNILCYFSSRDKKNKMFDQYLNNYDQIGDDDLRQSIQAKEYLEIQNKKLFSYLGDIRKRAVCELGIGQGWLLKELLKASPEKVVGIDICLSYLKNIHTKFNEPTLSLLLANAECLPFADHFDVLIAADILEHVLNVGDFMYCAHRALKKGGKLVLKVPYLENINLYSRYKGCPYDFVHLRNFSKQSLKILVEQAGFMIQKIHLDGFYWDSKRAYLEKLPFFKNLIDKYYISNFKTSSHVTGISNFIGKLIMRPLEITVIAEVNK
jgi:SAM-dependent methyltransferase